MSVDIYLDRIYDYRKYNCLHFARDVWLDLTGVDIGDSLNGLMGNPEDREPSKSHFKRFQRLASPITPCLAMMVRPQNAPHIGVFLNDRILHISPNGVTFQHPEVASFGFTSVRYYSCR